MLEGFRESREQPRIEDRLGLKIPSKMGDHTLGKGLDEPETGFESDRWRLIRRCRNVVLDQTNAEENHVNIRSLFLNKDFLSTLYRLFLNDSELYLDEWMECLRSNLSWKQFDHVSSEQKTHLLDLILDLALEESLRDHFQDVLVTFDTFEMILANEKIADADQDGLISIENLMNCLITISKPWDFDVFSSEQVQLLEQVFRHNFPRANTQGAEITLDDFAKVMPAKNSFFVRRTFSLFDLDGDGKISLAEFIDTMRHISSTEPNEKALFLFRLYDLDGDGLLQEGEIQAVIRACIQESGMELPESDVNALSHALYEEAAIGGTARSECQGIRVEDLRRVFHKHPGLLENLNFSLATWMTPKRPDKMPGLQGLQRKRSSHGGSEVSPWLLFRSKFALRHIVNQWQLYIFVAIVAMVNIGLFTIRAKEFRGMHNLNGSKPNVFYMISRGCGRCLLFDSVLVFSLILRYSITQLRNLGLSSYLPLDYHIYLHKVTGATIFVLSWIHTVMHLLNFRINVQPDPLKFVQLNSKFWDVPHYVVEDQDEIKPYWQKLGYNIPPGCMVVPCNRKDIMINTTATKMCQECNSTMNGWTYVDWILTPKPGVFGLINGWANPTGIALIVVLTIITICSMPFVRKSGYFQVFYFTHLLYWSYVLLLVLHAPTFWEWIFVPMVIFIVEKVQLGISSLLGQGKTCIMEGITMASRVTKLVIRRPFSFKFSPGDWVFVRIPEIAQYEWHPFTISSAPEQPDVLTVHVRAVGNWTNSVYQFYERVKRQQGVGMKRIDHGILGGGCVNFAMQYDASTHIIVPTYAPPKPELTIYLDGPFGAPASNFFRAEHAVFVATGIGVTPFSSILQSIMHRYLEAKRSCPRCHHKWSEDPTHSMMNLNKVDFFWINRDQKSFEWFITLLDKMEREQDELESGTNATERKRFLDFHLYFTSALKKTDLRGVALQLAMDLLYERERRDVITKLKVRTNAGRPNWNRVFSSLRENARGKITVFYCGHSHLGRILRKKCEDFGFSFKKESF